MEKRNCVVCGLEFPPNRVQQVLCGSRDCRIKRARLGREEIKKRGGTRKRRRGLSILKKGEKIYYCEECGVVCNPNRRWCKSCHAEISNHYDGYNILGR